MKNSFGLLIITITATACHHVYYAPNTANAPMFSEKGETRVNALYSVGGDSEFSGGEIQLAHAVAKNIGVMVNAFWGGKTQNTSTDGNTSRIEKGNGNYFEIAGGYFKPLGIMKRWIAEAYGGIGFGSIKNEYAARDYSQVNITKFFIQPSISYKSENFEVALVPKLSLVNWKVNKSTINSPENNTDRDIIAAIKSDPSFFAFEPTFLLRAGFEGFKLQTGFTVSNNSPTSLLARHITESFTGQLGISLNIKPPKR